MLRDRGFCLRHFAIDPTKLFSDGICKFCESHCVYNQVIAKQEPELCLPSMVTGEAPLPETPAAPRKQSARTPEKMNIKTSGRVYISNVYPVRAASDPMFKDAAEQT